MIIYSRSVPLKNESKKKARRKNLLALGEFEWGNYLTASKK